MSSATPRWWQLAAYGLLGLPLAMAALPVYVQVASYYLQYGTGLAMLGWVMFARACSTRCKTRCSAI
jgi:hypothetical protein